MAFVVCEPCRDCKYTDCVTVCPVDAFYQDERMLYIHPDECICCGACVPECPAGAIHDEDAVPGVWRQYIRLNAERAAALAGTAGGHITEQQEPLAGPGCRGV